MASTRRQWLCGVGAAIVAAPLVRCRGGGTAAPTRLGTIIGGGAYGVSDRPTEARYALSLIDLDRGGRVELDVAFTVHGFAPDPTRARRAVCFEKQGPGACEVDLRAPRVVRPLPPTPGRGFYGHGTFSRDGRALYAVETTLGSGVGAIVVRDGASLDVLGEFPSYGHNPHDCVPIDGGAALLITNGGGTIDGPAPCVTIVDVASQRLLEQKPIPDLRWNAGHVAMSAAGEVVAVSAPRDGRPRGDLGGVSIGTRTTPLLLVTDPVDVVRRLTGESLSVAIDDAHQVAGVTTPSAGLLTFWDLRTRALRAHHALPLARGLCRTLDGSAFVVSHSGGQLDRIDPGTLALDPAATITGTKLSGSHLYAWDPRA
ncbi:MAG: DUF1513 domain-containing protein [Myxococcales bacterium]|nr:DUF1513 domain-containing protein [Myxococcales bacterium]